MATRRIGVDEDGRIIIPGDLAGKMGIVPGDELFIEEGRDRILVHRSVSTIARIYIEPTSLCNLKCATCIRNVWDEENGHMDFGIFSRILDYLDRCDTPPELFFGGFGEPLSHPRIIEMIAEGKKRGSRIELITNGILLDSEMAAKLIEMKLDRLWISIDGASPAGYEDVRLGDQLPLILNNVRRLKELRRRSSLNLPAMGISFVAMKRNIGELNKIHNLMYQLGGDALHVSNVLPHTEDMKEEILYAGEMDRWTDSGDRVLFPRMDVNNRTAGQINQLMSRFEMHDLVDSEFRGKKNSCPFAERGSVSVRWDGAVSPCLPLVHSSESYFKGSLRRNRSYSFGTLKSETIDQVWNKGEYRDFRKRLMEFDFSPCTSCTGCEMSESNESDCYGSVPISCGGCLWAQGFIRCP